MISLVYKIGSFLRSIPGWLCGGLTAALGFAVILWRTYAAGQQRARERAAYEASRRRDEAGRQLHEQEVRSDAQRREAAREAERQNREVQRRADEARAHPPKTEIEADAEARRLLEESRRRLGR